MTLRSRISVLFPNHAREGGVVLFGDVVSKFLTFLITVLLLRLVTPDEYALYGLFITILATLNQFTDSGLHQSFIRFYAYYRADAPERAHAHLRFALRAKLIALAGASLLLLLTADILANLVLRTPALAAPLRLLALGVIGSGCFEFAQAVFQARQQFRSLTALRVAEGAGKIALIGGLVATDAFSLDAVFVTYVAVPLVVAAFGMAMIRRMIAPSTLPWRDVGLEIYRFGRWMMLTSFATMFLMRLDVFMIAPLLSHEPTQVGLYNAAVRLCTPLIVLTGSVSTVFFPKAMAIRRASEMREYVRKTLLVTLPLVAVSSIYLMALWVVLPTWFPNYTDAFPMFAVLFIGYAWTIVGNPLTMLILTIDRADVVALISAVQLVVTLASHWVFITSFGAIGAAVSTLIMWLLAGSWSMIYIYRHRHDIERKGREV